LPGSDPGPTAAPACLPFRHAVGAGGSNRLSGGLRCPFRPACLAGEPADHALAGTVAIAGGAGERGGGGTPVRLWPAAAVSIATGADPAGAAARTGSAAPLLPRWLWLRPGFPGGIDVLGGRRNPARNL